MTGQQENFTFDSLNRLTGFYEGTMEYETNGNIHIKPKTGEYSYNSSRPNAVETVEGELGQSLQPDEDITWTWFNKVSHITDTAGSYELAFAYGPDYSRVSMKTYLNGSLSKTKYYAGSYEKVVEAGGDTTEYTYIGALSGMVAVDIKRSGQADSLYYIHSDYLGSIMTLTNEQGNVADRFGYDAWGRRRDPADWSEPDTTEHLIDRGYTGHEHLDHFGLINMNGRVYDPASGRMLSPDPVMDMGSTQGINRYSYVMNNPLVYTDPTGYITYAFNEALDAYNSDLFKRQSLPHGGGSSFTWWKDYNRSIFNGYTGTTDEFLAQYDSPNYDGTVSNSYSFWITIGNSPPPKSKIELNKNNQLDEVSARPLKITVYIDDVATNGGGDFNENTAGLPEWASKTSTGIAAFTTTNGVKTELIEFAGKSAPLGKAGAQYLKYAKGLGYVGAGLSTTYTIANAGTYYYNGGTDWQVGAKATLDVIMTGVGFLGPIGLGISATYFIIDAAGGFGDFGEIKP